jgi:hypothetical protein
MRWDRGHHSDFVDDRRGERPGGGLGGAGLWLLWLIFRRFGIVGVLVAVALFVGVTWLSSGPTQGVGDPSGQGTAEPEEAVAFVSFVLDDVQATWGQTLGRRGIEYEPARLVLFSGSVDSACGLAGAAVGPFYCPRDHKVYIDLSFYDALSRRLGAGGDFAQAYVIAHEIGHHVQHELGTLDGRREQGAGGGSVRAELQADCYAGVWGHSTAARSLLERGDVEEAIAATQAIGDDALQRRSEGIVRPESWTHGSSAQRRRWFERGFQSGDPTACDTFSVAQP